MNPMFIEWKLITVSNGYKENNGNIDKEQSGLCDYFKKILEGVERK